MPSYWKAGDRLALSSDVVEAALEGTCNGLSAVADADAGAGALRLLDEVD